MITLFYAIWMWSVDEIGCLRAVLISNVYNSRESWLGGRGEQEVGLAASSNQNSSWRQLQYSPSFIIYIFYLDFCP